MMKKIVFISFIIHLFLISSVSAVPAYPMRCTLHLADGTTVSATLRGDEYCHYYTDDEGNCYQQAEGGIALPVTFQHLQAQRSANARRRQHQPRISTLTTTFQPRLATANIGQKRGLVILVEFSDYPMVTENSQQEFDRLFNEEGYSKNRHMGSVRDYFRDQSYNQLTIDFDVVGPYRLPHEMSYYGKNKEDGFDLRPGTMAAEACLLANRDVNFRQYDWNKDGAVDQVFIIYAGYSESWGAPSTTIWPHKWQISESEYNKALRLDGVVVDTYACGSELRNASGKVMDGIGTAAHEFSHCLGLYDFYNTDSNASSFGMGNWSILDNGCYNGPIGYEGNVPAAYTAYERYYVGWLQPTPLDRPAVINGLLPITQQPQAYIIRNPGNPDEFFMLENIQKTSWNTYADGHGMLVTHIDYDAEVWEENRVNADPSHQRYTIVPADNALIHSAYSNAGDPYPGTRANWSLTDSTKPALRLYSPSDDGSYRLNYQIENIQEASNGTISFIFNGGAPVIAFHR